VLVGDERAVIATVQISRVRCAFGMLGVDPRAQLVDGVTEARVIGLHCCAPGLNEVGHLRPPPPVPRHRIGELFARAAFNIESEPGNQSQKLIVIVVDGLAAPFSVQRIAERRAQSMDPPTNTLTSLHHHHVPACVT
jgi:hypothetical protein